MARRPNCSTAILTTLACIGLAGATLAQDQGASSPGSLIVRNDDGTTTVELPLRHTAVSVEISAFVATTRIEQTFGNPFEQPIEGVYTFPLGHAAAVDEFEMVVGERVIRGEIRRRDEAREIYAAARAAGRNAALLEQVRPNIFTQSVANILPGSDVVVRIRTVELLTYEAGTYRYTFPLVVGPRYIPGALAAVPDPAGLAAASTGSEIVSCVSTSPVPPTPAVPDAPRVTPPVLLPGFRSGHDVSIEVTLDAGVPLTGLSSPSHRIETRSFSASTWTASLAAGDTIPNKDFLLRWSVSATTPEVAVLTHRSGIDGYFAVIVQPEGEIEPDEAAPKEVVLVLDTSGSMKGVPIEAAKRFVRDALRSLGPRDTFRLVRFAGNARTFAPDARPNEPDEIEAALRWVESLEGSGSTEMLAGFRAALAPPPDPDRVRLAIFLTDGYIGNEQQIFAAITGSADRARVFTLGIGSSVNHHLLDGMARRGRGAYTFIRPDADVAAAVDRFRSWVTRPYLTDIEIDWGALPVLDLMPERPPDLFSGQTLHVVGRYAGEAAGEITVRGRLPGRYWEKRVAVELPERRAAHGALASVWARQRIGELTRSAPRGVTPAIEAEITALALEFRLMSAYTSFVAVDEWAVANVGGESDTVRQPVPLPEGVSFDGVFGANGPTLRPVRAPADIVARTPPAPAALMERVTVTATRDVADLEATGNATRFSDEFIQDLPVPGRFYQNVVTMAPGVQGPDGSVPPTVHGSRSRDFKAMVGGISNVEPLTGLVNPNSIEEVDVITAGVGVEFGRAQGGFARIIQKQGQASAPVDDLADRALRVLADLAEDGTLSPAEGIPALAALLASQQEDGAFAGDPGLDALAAWAVWEAQAALPGEPWVARAAQLARDHQVRRARPGTGADDDVEPVAPGPDEAGPVASIEDATSRTVRLALAFIMRASSAGAGRPLRPRPIDRLVDAIPRGRLVFWRSAGKVSAPVTRAKPTRLDPVLSVPSES